MALLLAAMPTLQVLHDSRAGVVVVHKPPGLPFGGADGLMALLRHQQQEGTLKVEGRLYPVHRQGLG